ncbi:Glycosyl hydrolases family 2, TIM barrel domain [Mariniphaga anaerophila]|uniref:Glycosyl hydrolases family 2, TIM barrel domain n=1 Tax=Mariniphaga anaerophila TaxID=1484053 RepID=A0A1M4SL74_9BACT|nr:glycoside hydrolase family 2 [Mariniphaga anaerophila]SHE32902.1 Glycosyl hydrolases family 2, TIM barrel domain [Mariniphaga anaerophila]
MKLRLVVILFLQTLFMMSASAQSLNFGLRQKQDENELPKSSYSYQTYLPKPKKNIKGRLDRITDWDYSLAQGWEMIEAYKVTASDESVFSLNLNTETWYNATVPGTVLTTLVEQGVYPDPYWGLNNLAIPDSLCRMAWWYRNVFELEENKKGDRIKLLFNGINYKAEIWLNSKLLGTIAGAFSRGQFDITPYVNLNKKNILAVKIFPPNNPGIPHEENSIDGQGANGGALCLDGPTFISSEGWDWIPGIRDRNIGIWQDVHIKFGGGVEIIDPQIITDLPLPDTGSVNLTINTKVKNNLSVDRNLSLHININDIDANYNFSLSANEIKELKITKQQCMELFVKNPKLWWPNGYGAQNLYNMKLSLLANKDTLDVKNIRFGVRELEYELMAYNEEKDNIRLDYNPIKALADQRVVFDNTKRKKITSGMYVPYLEKSLTTQGITEISDPAMDAYIIVKVNGQRIYCKGGNWGMDDAMKRVSRERLEPYFKLHKNQNYTMVRNWTGESTEELFYDLCDEYGLLVFNDFWLSTENFNLDVLDYKLFMDNVTETVRRFRNHPSIALWCPRNEGFASDLLESQIAKFLAAEDITRHYIGNSRELNSANSGPWHYQFDPAFYYSLAGGFRSEVGTPSLPTAETVKEFMAIEDTWPIGDVWYYHDWHMTPVGDSKFAILYKEGIDKKMGDSDNLQEFTKKAQIINYESHRAIFEAWNSKMWNDASGILLWMSHPAWPSMVWQTYSSNGETSGAYYGAQKACTFLHVQMSLDKHQIDVINTSLHSYKNLILNVSIYNLDGTKLSDEDIKIKDIAPNNLTPITELTKSNEKTGLHFVKLTLKDRRNKVVDDNTYWLTDKNFNLKGLSQLPKVTIKTFVKNIVEENGKLRGTVLLHNASKSIAASISLDLRDRNSGKRVLPVYFNDGYFFMMPDEKKEVTFEVDKTNVMGALDLSVEGYNVDRKLFGVE